MIVKQYLEFLSLKEAAENRMSLYLSKCQIVGNLMPECLEGFKFGLNKILYDFIFAKLMA